MERKMYRPFHCFFSLLLVIFSIGTFLGCEKDQLPAEKGKPELQVEKNYKLPKIDLSHWKVTLPIGDPSEIEPPEILNYATNEILKKFMYNDSTDGSLVFYTYPESSTKNSLYSRTELREQMRPGNNNVNWRFDQGGSMRGVLSVPEVSKNQNGEYDRIIVMQIHGRLTNEQRDLIGEDDNNAPPILKIYWTDGKVRVKTKVLRDVNASDQEILKTTAWGDDAGFNFTEKVGHSPFTVEIKASEGRMEITLNDEETVIYDNIHIQRWSIFENYFKAGNYLATTREDAFSKVKYYELEVAH